MATFLSRSREVRAIHWFGGNIDEALEFFHLSAVRPGLDGVVLVIASGGTVLRAHPGDWVLVDAVGDLRVVHHGAFARAFTDLNGNTPMG